MATLIYTDTNEQIQLSDGASLIEPCEELGVPFACTEGVCGTCVIQVVEGMENLSPFNEVEQDFLGEQTDERLACQCILKRGTVKITF